MTYDKAAVIGMAVLVAAAFATAVWPTRYRYDHVNLNGTVLPVRIERLTGRTEILQGMRGWVHVREGDRPGGGEQAPKLLPPEELAKVTGNAGLAYDTLFQGKLYNGSSYDLREIVFTVTAREPTGEERWSRQFRDDVFIKPLTTGSFQIEVTGAKGAKTSWSIDAVRGIPTRDGK